MKLLKGVWALVSLYRQARKDGDLWKLVTGPVHLTILATREAEYRAVFGTNPPFAFHNHPPVIREQCLNFTIRLGACGVKESHAIEAALGLWNLLFAVGRADIGGVSVPLVWVIARGYAKREDVMQICQCLPQTHSMLRDSGIPLGSVDRVPSGVFLAWLRGAA